MTTTQLNPRKHHLESQLYEPHFFRRQLTLNSTLSMKKYLQLLGNTRLSFCWPTSCCLCIWSVINRLKVIYSSDHEIEPQKSIHFEELSTVSQDSSKALRVHLSLEVLFWIRGFMFPPKRYCIFYETERSNFEMALLVWRLIFASFEVQSKFSGGFKRSKVSSRSGVKNIEALRLGFVRLFHGNFFSLSDS